MSRIKKYKKDNNSQYRHLKGVDPSAVQGNRSSLSDYKQLLSEPSHPRKEKGRVGKSTSSSEKSRNKYGAQKSEVDGLVFDSKVEAYRYIVLKDMVRKKLIRDLELQVSFEIIINDIKICNYIADFCYYCTQTNSYIVEDVKGKRHPVYQLKKKMMLACHGIDIKEVTWETVND